MREKLYKAIQNRLGQLYVLPDGQYHYQKEDDAEPLSEGAEKAVCHVDLWNRNVEFVESDTPWARPAVFIEFKAIPWTRVKDKVLRGTTQVHLHIVTDWTADEDGLGVFRFSDFVTSAIDGLSGLSLAETHTNHDHEDLVESIEVFNVRVQRNL